MQKWILWLILSECVFSNANAADCASYQDKIHKLEDLSRHGGSFKQMERWRIQTDELTSKKSHCSESSAIHIATGNSSTQKAKNKGSRETIQKLRKSNNQDPQVQQLLSTCNYWITQQNESPSTDNSTFRNSACRNLDDKLAMANKPVRADLPSVRGLMDCIKPNNLIDDDVQQCRQGLRDPIWKH